MQRSNHFIVMNVMLILPQIWVTFRPTTRQIMIDIDFTDIPLQDQEAHLLICLDKWVEKFSGTNNSWSQEISENNDKKIEPELGIRSAIFYCVICDVDISKKGLLNRSLHLKKCAKDNKIATKELLTLLEPMDIDDSFDQSDIDYLPVSATSTVEVASDSKVKQPRNAWEVLMSSSAKQASGFLNKKGMIPVAIKAPGIRNSFESAETTSKKQYKGKSGSFGVRNTENNPLKYVPAYKKVQSTEMKQPIIVDGFQFASSSLSDCYFLTHFHSDHYTGLSKSFSYGTIYCSAVTASLVRLKLKLTGTCITPLQLEKTYEISVGGSKVEVVLMDANHCPGAVCILFSFSGGKKVFHTGDFRWTNDLCLKSPTYRSLASTGKTSNVRNLTVYLDTTYCQAEYDFPSQNSVIQDVISVVGKEARDESVLFLFGAYTIGKERLFMAVAEYLECKVYVDNTRWRTMLCFDWLVKEQAQLTKEAERSRIWVVHMNQINFNNIEALQKKKRGCQRVVAFLPTGWTHNNSNGGHDKYASTTKSVHETVKTSKNVDTNSLHARHKNGHTIYSVPYSEHSSFTELVDFIRLFRPQHVVPTVNTSLDKVKTQIELLKTHSGVYNKNISTNEPSSEFR